MIEDYLKVKKEKDDLSIKNFKISENIKFNESLELKYQRILNFKKIYLVLFFLSLFFSTFFCFSFFLLNATHLVSIVFFIFAIFPLLFGFGFFIDHNTLLKNLNILLKKKGKNTYKSKNITKNNLKSLKNDNKELYLQKSNNSKEILEKTLIENDFIKNIKHEDINKSLNDENISESIVSELENLIEIKITEVKKSIEGRKKNISLKINELAVLENQSDIIVNDWFNSPILMFYNLIFML